MVHICVIGAGTAGLCAAKTANQNGCQVTVFEQAKQVGGTWVYTDHVGKDEYGLDVHTSMYQGLQYVEQNTYYQFEHLHGKMPIKKKQNDE